MGLFSSREKCFCAFCKSERTVYRTKRVGWIHIIEGTMASSVIMAGVWHRFDPRVVLIFVAYLAIAESFLQFRWRLGLICKHCGFDPSLYLKDSDLAAEKVKTFLEKRRSDPSYLLRPKLNLPKVIKSE